MLERADRNRHIHASQLEQRLASSEVNHIPLSLSLSALGQRARGGESPEVEEQHEFYMPDLIDSALSRDQVHRLSHDASDSSSSAYEAANPESCLVLVSRSEIRLTADR